MKNKRQIFKESSSMSALEPTVGTGAQAQFMNVKSFIRKSILMSAFLLAFCTGAFAVINWGGTYGNPAAFTYNQTLTDNVVLWGNVTVTVNSGVKVVISGIISANGNNSYTLTKAGSGDLRLTGPNTYPGNTIINAGILTIGDAGQSGIVAGNIEVKSGAFLDFRRTNTYTYSKVISGAGKVYQSGLGKTILSGVNTYAGPTTIQGGTLQVGNGTSGSIASAVEITSASAILRFELGAGATMIFSKVISGPGKVEYKGASNSQFNITADNTYAGTTTIESGLFIIGNSATAGSVAGNIIDNGTLVFNHSTAKTYSGIISGTGELHKWGPGKLTLTGVNTYSGKTRFWYALQIGNGTSGSIANTAQVELADATAILRFEPGDGTNGTTFSKVISGAGKVEYKGTSWGRRLYLTGNNTYSGTTTIEQGDLFMGSNGNLGAIVGNISVAAGAHFNFNRSDAYTYAGVISSGGDVWTPGSGKVTLTGANTYGGITHITGGTLQVGNGTSGSINGTSKVEIGSGKILRFEPGAIMNFDKVISGTDGKVEYKGSTTKILRFTADNTYTGTTTIETGGDFYIGNNTSKGDVKGNISVAAGAYLNFYHSGSYTYSGVISGAGQVWQYCIIASSIVTLTKANTYTGKTYIGAPLVLSATGSIESSSEVVFRTYAAAKLDISAGDKKIKALSSDGFGEVVLGSKTLTIGTAGQSDGGGTFDVKFSGTGGVTKTGNGTFKMSGANTATGLFALNQGKVEFSNKWAGDFNIAAGATLDVKGAVTVSKMFNMLGGNIYMTLTGSNPSKVTATGAASAVGTNTLYIASGEVTNHIIMQAASGFNSTDPYTLNMPGYTATLTATGTLLLLTATITDTTPPVPGAGVFGTASDQTAELNWVAATDNDTPKENLRYFVYQSSSNNITTVANCEANGTLLNAGGSLNIIEYSVSGLTPDATYYFNVVVADMANNKAAYKPLELGTNDEPKVVSIEISPGSATVPQGGTQQFTVTVVAVGGADESVMWNVIGNTSTLTAITADGLLTIGSNESATSITVKAISNFDPTIFDEATVTVSSVGIVETGNELSVKVYPNPTRGELTIDNGELKIENIEIFDMMGRKVQSSECLNFKPETLNISNLPTGTYFLRIQTENGIITKKIIKQ